MKLTLKKKSSYDNKRKIAGLLFTSPFVIGFIFFFLSPLLMYFSMGFSNLNYSNDGMTLSFIGVKNYIEVLFVQSDFFKQLVESIQELSIIFPSVLLYSFFIAILLNQKFKGRTIARAIFFIPVIIASGVAAASQNDTLITSSFNMLGQTDQASGADVMNLTKLLMSLFGSSIDSGLLSIISGAIERINTITTYSGIQILIFLAGLQTISPSLYEASSIEGATKWEDFWKITFPMLTPLILVNAVYTIVEVMGGSTNKIINNLYRLSINESKYGISSAMGTVYFAIIFATIGIVIFFISKIVFYEEK